jgi:hypothetical protein
MKNAIRIGNKKFVPVGKLADTLFAAGGTADGEYRKVRSGVKFFGPDGKIRAFLCANGFFVTASPCPTTGKPFYMFGLAESTVGSTKRIQQTTGYSGSCLV